MYRYVFYLLHFFIWLSEIACLKSCKLERYSLAECICFKLSIYFTLILTPINNVVHYLRKTLCLWTKIHIELYRKKCTYFIVHKEYQNTINSAFRFACVWHENVLKYVKHTSIYTNCGLPIYKYSFNLLLLHAA